MNTGLSIMENLMSNKKIKQKMIVRIQMRIWFHLNSEPIFETSVTFQALCLVSAEDAVVNKTDVLPTFLEPVVYLVY